MIQVISFFPIRPTLRRMGLLFLDGTSGAVCLFNAFFIISFIFTQRHPPKHLIFLILILFPGGWGCMFLFPISRALIRWQHAGQPIGWLSRRRLWDCLFLFPPRSGLVQQRIKGKSRISPKLPSGTSFIRKLSATRSWVFGLFVVIWYTWANFEWRER